MSDYFVTQLIYVDDESGDVALPNNESELRFSVWEKNPCVDIRETKQDTVHKLDLYA